MHPALLSAPQIPRAGAVYFPPSGTAGAKGVLYVAQDREIAAYLADDSGSPTPLFSLQVGQRATLDRVGATLRVFLPGRTLQFYDASDPSHPLYLGSTVLPSPSSPRPPGYRRGITLSARAGVSIPAWQDDTIVGGLGSLEGSFGIAGGYAVNRARNIQILLSLQTDFFRSEYNSQYKILIPIGVQYDLAIPRVPRLYLSSRFQIGYGQQIVLKTPNHYYGNPDQSVIGQYDSMLILPELGIKYAFQQSSDRVYFEFDFFSLPILFSPHCNLCFHGNGQWGNYRFLLSLGINL